ncbi:tRNA1(Val) (adenine(37)-N6)-methyltransferase [Wenyingzhuangia sp. IMCC45533]
MKVGTDGVLLGAWTPVKNMDTILDIGTGTGLISLMLAQRNQSANIDALEIDQDACKEANLNFRNSDWSERLSLFQKPLASYQTENKYDLIVSNPPYYTDTFKSEASKRTLARHVGNLTFDVLLKCTERLLKANGICSFILPNKEEQQFLEKAYKVGLYPSKITRVRGRKDLEIKRTLLLLTRERRDCCCDELVIEIDRHLYTKEYISLTKDFYIKM